MPSRPSARQRELRRQPPDRNARLRQGSRRIGHGRQEHDRGHGLGVNAEGSDNTLSVTSTKSIVVAGNKNTVTIAAADKSSAIGNENTITWEQGLFGAKAKASSMGSNNTISQAN